MLAGSVDGNRKHYRFKNAARYFKLCIISHCWNNIYKKKYLFNVHQVKLDYTVSETFVYLFCIIYYYFF